MDRFDVIIIGMGPGGEAAAGRLLAAGQGGERIGSPGLPAAGEREHLRDGEFGQHRARLPAVGAGEPLVRGWQQALGPITARLISHSW